MSPGDIHPIDCACPDCRAETGSLRLQAGLFVFGICLFLVGALAAIGALLAGIAKVRP